MADRITDERLRDIVERGGYCLHDEAESIAAELLAARAEVNARLKDAIGVLRRLRNDMGMLVFSDDADLVDKILNAEVNFDG